MSLYDAIAEMRQISKKKESFSFSFMSFSRSRQTSDGIVEVSNARLRPKKKSHKPADQVLENYVDVNTGEARKFYACTLMTFNGRKVELT